MERSKLRKRCLHERIDQAKGLYYNKINLCVSILRKNKRGNVENKIVSGSWRFWRTVSPLLAEKDFDIESMKLKTNNKSITNNK